MNKELLKGLSEEQIAKLKTCSSGEEILAAAKKEGVSLTDEQLEAVSGGDCSQCDIDIEMTCPKCGAWEGVHPDGDHYRCEHCKMDFGHRNVN